MQANPQKIKLDMTSKATATAQVVRVMRYDSKSRPVSASIYDDGAFRDDLNVDNARLYIESLSDAPPTYVESIAIVSGIADFTIPQSATLTAGIMRAELRVVDSASSQVITSMPFVIECIRSVYSDDAVMGTDNGDVLVNTVAKATESAKKAALLAAAANLSDQNSRENAESASASAQAAAESAAQAAESVDSNAVKFSTEQELSDEQKVVARKNIGAVDEERACDLASKIANNALNVEIFLRAVMYTQNQMLNSEQKAQARSNIGAVGTNSVSTTTSVQYPDEMIPTVGAVMTFAYNLLNGNAVKYSLAQKLSDEQKNTARENIGAVAADNVVFTKSDKPEAEESELIYSIAGIQNLLCRNAVLSTIDQSASEVANWTDAKKAQARKNIDVDGGKWVLLRTYTTDGVNKAFGDGTTANAGTTTTDGDGNALSLSAVSVVFKNTAAASANSYIACFAYCNADNESLSAGYAISTNAINTKANAQGVAMVLPERGYYRSLSVNGGTNASVNLCENPSQMFSTASNNTIKRIKITLGAIPPEGDIIEIWGIKA